MSFSLSCCKYPEAEAIPTIWRENVEPLRKLVKNLSTGVRAVVTDNTQNPLRDTKVKIGSVVYGVSKNMAYFKAILPPGVYNAVFTCPGFDEETVEITVKDDEVTNLEVILRPSDSSHTSAKPVVKKLSEVNQVLDDLNGRYPKISTLHEIGVSQGNNKILALEIHSEKNGDNHSISKPSIVFTAGVGQGPPATSKTLLHFATDILTKYKNDVQITDYVQNFSIFVIPELYPDTNRKDSCSYIPENALDFPLKSGKIE